MLHMKPDFPVFGFRRFVVLVAPGRKPQRGDIFVVEEPK
jgi:hypothetical protein